MRMQGWCTGCRRIRQVSVTGAGLATALSAGLASGLCDECGMDVPDLLREAKRLHPLDLAARATWLRNHRSQNAHRALELLRNGRAS